MTITRIFMGLASILMIFVGIMTIFSPMPKDNLNLPDTKRYIDQEAGVVCWIYSPGTGGGGISCLSLKDTLLPATEK
jgi:hypothetical protein